MFTTTVWVAEGFLALFFLMAGLPKIAGRGIDRWVGFDAVPRGMTILIGVCEIAAAVGVVVPILVGQAEWTTPLAALGISVISLLASGFHLRNGEWLAALETVLWASLAATIGAARWDKFASGPTISQHDVVGPVLIVLVAAVIIILVILGRVSAPAKPAQVEIGK